MSFGERPKVPKAAQMVDATSKIATDEIKYGTNHLDRPDTRFVQIRTAFGKSLCPLSPNQIRCKLLGDPLLRFADITLELDIRRKQPSRLFTHFFVAFTTAGQAAPGQVIKQATVSVQNWSSDNHRLDW